MDRLGPERRPAEAKRSPLRSFGDLDVYQRGREARRGVYAAVAVFPAIAGSKLANQMRSAAHSVTGNIAEGWAKRASVAKFKRFLRISFGSANEMEPHLDAACDVGYLESALAAELNEQYRIAGAQLLLIANWRDFKNPPSTIHPPSSRRRD